MDPLLLITRADAGHANALGTALEVLGEQVSVEVCETSNPGELDGVLHRAGSRPIVVAGGDGGLHAVIATLHRRNDLAGKTLGLLPFGRTNEFARALDIPTDPADAATALLKSSPRPMDLIVDELGEVAANDIQVGKQGPGSFGLGPVGYPLRLALAVLRPPLLRLRIEVDGVLVTDVDRQVAWVAITTTEAGLNVAITFSSGPLSRLGHAINRFRSNSDRLLSLRGRQVSLSGEDFLISADGETSGPERRRTWHVEPAAYSMLLP